MVTTSDLATTVIAPIEILNNTNNPFEQDLLRGTTYNIEVENALGQQASLLVNTPPRLLVANTSININTTPVGSTLTVDVINYLGLELSYSLDNATWQISNIFPSVINGNYTVYVKDQLGCSISINIIVDNFGISNPYTYISKSNSIGFAYREDFDFNYKTDENTLSCEAFAQNQNLAYTEFYLLNNSDNRVTQFQSSFENISAKVIQEDGTEMVLVVEKKSNNIGLNDSRDAVKYNLANGKTGIYFISGNLYDFNSGVDIGDYFLNGALPSFAKIGTYIFLENNWFLIEDIFFDNNKNADVLIINNTYTGIDTSIIVKSIYNLDDFEVYEFTLNCLLFTDQNIRIEVIHETQSLETVTMLSEIIKIREKHEKTVEIEYSNTTNLDVDYSTGIKHKLILEITSIKGVSDDESETYKTDTNALLLDSKVYEVDEFIFGFVTKSKMYKIVQALSHNDITINGIGYVKMELFNLSYKEKLIYTK